MLKTMKSGLTYSYPINKKTAFKCEGYEGAYSVIDAVTYCDFVYVLLEHNTWGDETALLVAALPPKHLSWYVVERNDGITVKRFFIEQEDIIDDTWDLLLDVMLDYDPDATEEDFEFWTDEEIDNMEGI